VVHSIAFLVAIMPVNITSSQALAMAFSYPFTWKDDGFGDYDGVTAVSSPR
jgi:hypothetical protein